MNIPVRNLLIALLACGLVALSNAAPIPITVGNFSFETPALPDGGFTSGSTPIPSWIQGDTTFSWRNGNHNSDNTQFPNATGGNLPPPAHGAQAAYINFYNGAAGSFSQVLSDVWTGTDNTFKLTVALGYRLDNIPGTIILELRAGSTGGTLVASGSANTIAYVGTPGTYRDFSISYTTNGSESFIGQPIYISIKKTESVNLEQVKFDNVRVTRDPSYPVLPVLNWQERSDWINVKTDVTPAAVGNGIADDTAAIQAALNQVSSNAAAKVVYLPPGTYKITDTLKVSQNQGGLLVGHGRDTILRWAGAQDGRMFWSDGFSRARYVGIIWDGDNVAGVGIDHDSVACPAVENYSFESPILADGTSTTGTGSIPGWILGGTNLSMNGVANYQNAQFAATTGGNLGWPAYEINAARLKTVSGSNTGSFSQKLVSNWDATADQTTTLTVALGWPLDEPSPGDIVLELRAGSTGGTLVANGSVNTATRVGTQGIFRDFSVSTTTTGTESFIGQPIYITIKKTGSGAVVFDNVRVIWSKPHYYETRIRHQNEQFRNFRIAGIRAGKRTTEATATAEAIFDNCIFENCAYGARISWFNDYDNTFAGCEFRDCGTGIYCYYGNAYIRDCHFERSTGFDIYLGPHSHSVRRCTSIDAGGFLGLVGGSESAPLMVQDCRISRWKATAYLAPNWGVSPCAIDLSSRGPTTIFDTTFSDPPNGNPPIRLSHSHSQIQHIILSNNSSPSTSALLSNQYPPNPTWPNNYTSYIVPSGSYGPSSITAATSFFRKTANVPTSILDVTLAPYNVVRGSVNTTQMTLNTAAINNAIDAAKAQGNNCMVYFPVGVYRINGELDMTGSGGNYMLGGSGWASIIEYRGTGGNVFHLRDPDNLIMEQLRIDDPNNANPYRILQESTPASASSVRYDGVYFSIYTGILDRKGLEIRDLPANAKVVMPHLDGDAKFVNCSAGTILANVWYDGVMRLSSSQSTPRTGFIGVQSRLATSMPNSTLPGSTPASYATVIEGNDNLVVGDYYSEQGVHHLWLDGSSVTGIVGRVTIKGAKIGINSGADDILTINRYRGRVSYFNTRFRYQDPTRFTTGTAYDPITLVLAGNSFWYDSASSSHGALFSNFNQMLTRLVAVQNCVINSGSLTAVVPDGVPSGSDADLSGALDDFRLLGIYDLSINYP